MEVSGQFTHTGNFIPGKWASSTNWTGGSLGPRAGLDVTVKKFM
jgi:hypothetical protein